VKFLKHILAAALALAVFNAAAQPVNRVSSLGIIDNVGATQVNIEGQKNSYTAGLLANTPAATPTDVAILSGSATKTIKVTRVLLTVSATAAGVVQYQLVKRVGGTQSAVNTAFVANTHGALLDSNNPASTVITAGLAGVYTANPASLGTLSGVISAWYITMPANGTTVLTYDCVRPAQCPTLRGATQFLAVNGNSHALLAGEVFGITFEYSEE
jgi:hypothetical protein